MTTPSPDLEVRLPPPATVELRGSWRVVAAAMLGLGLGSGASLYWIGVLIGPLSREFGWSNSAISGWALLLNISANLFAPISGLLADRFGARRVALWSIPLISFGFAGVGLTMNSLWILYLGAIIVGIAGSASVTYTRTISGWFNSGRGIALGIAFSGIGLTSMAGPRITQMVVDSLGWRVGFIFIGAMTLLPLPAIYFWLYERRETVGRQTVAPESGYVVLEVLRLPAFWLIGAGGLLYFLCYTGVQFNLIPFLTEKGMDRASAANYAGALGAFVMMGKLGAGVILDRWRAPVVLALLLLVDALAIASLVLLRNGDLVFCLAAIGFAHGSVMNGVPYCVSRFFGMRRFASISGMVSILLGLSALGPLLFSVLRDMSGSFRESLFVSCGLVLGAGAIFAILGLYPYHATQAPIRKIPKLGPF